MKIVYIYHDPKDDKYLFPYLKQFINMLKCSYKETPDMENITVKQNYRVFIFTPEMRYNRTMGIISDILPRLSVEHIDPRFTVVFIPDKEHTDSRILSLMILLRNGFKIKIFYDLNDIADYFNGEERAEDRVWDENTEPLNGKDINIIKHL